ncbi:MAG: hypothetical protein HZB16_02000 [Armatimonadetes bacterium]|nr:hypothetical protein [Armatimonadota bacterium]
MPKRSLWLLLCLACAASWLPAQDLAAGFRQPPADAKPWVYWFWLNGNISREGIKADLEAMARVGIGGVLIMEVDQGAPDGPAPFASATWRELFRYMCGEAQRLGIAVNMNNDAGWCGSGGPWISPELSMQTLVWTETKVHGTGAAVDITLPRPRANHNYYRDVTVLALPQPADDAYRIADIAGRSGADLRHLPNTVIYPTAPAGAVVPREQVRDLTANMDAAGRLTWTAPGGDWLVLRLGHTTTGAMCAPAPAAGRGLECDKLSKTAVKAHFDGLMGKLCDDVGPLAGKTLVRTHIDSWEVGCQNWSKDFRADFQRLRGYDPLPWLPVVTGRVLDSQEASERFLWDFRRTISDLITDNYAGEFARLAHARGLEFSLEGYGEPADDLYYASRADEPMAEFWSYGAYGAANTCTVMSGAAHVYGRRILGAEAFTATDAEKWQAFPGSIKAIGDWAFCEGINRFVFHRYALQPWVNRPPGMSMGPWGLHYERTNTWWNDTGAWHRYLARCQHLLRQGVWAADILYVAPEGAPAHYIAPMRRPNGLDRPGYSFDLAPSQALVERVAVKDKRIVLPDGVSYRVLSLAGGGAYTPALLRRVKELLIAGATVVGERPRKSPSLAGYPACDAEVTALADELWGPGTGPVDRAVGAGRLVSGRDAQTVLADDGVAPDFASADRRGDQSLRFAHRRVGATDLYFVANRLPYPVEAVASFRVSGRRPELWWAEDGRMTQPAMWREEQGVTRLPLRLDATQSVFVVFAQPSAGANPVVTVSHGGQTWGAVPTPPPPLTILRATYGPAGDAARTIDVTDRVKALTAGGVRSFQVSRLAEGGDPAYMVLKTAVIAYEVAGQSGEVRGTDPETITFGGPAVPIEVVRASYGPEGDAARTIDVAAKVRTLAQAGQSSFAVTDLAQPVDPAPQVVKTLVLEYRISGKTISETLRDGDQVLLQGADAGVRAVRAVTRGAEGGVVAEVEEPGAYDLALADGKVRHVEVPAWSAELPVAGPWSLRFAPGGGAPAQVKLARLLSWSQHDDPGVRYFSGSGTYATTVTVPAAALGANRRVYLDLGRVAVMAAVRLNGKDLGVLWKAPYRVDVTGVAKAGANALEVRVVNQWINRQIGDEQLPDDSDRHGNGTLRAWPEWLAGTKPSPTGRITFTSWRLWRKDSPLAESGLLGPVTLRTTTLVAVPGAG